MPIEAILLCIAWLIQSYFSYRQTKHIQKSYKNLVNQYAKDYCIGYGHSKGRFWGMGKGCVIFVVTDKNMIVKDNLVLSGISVFSKMKQDSQLIGRHLLAQIKEKNPSYSKIAEYKNKRPVKKSSQEKALALATQNIYDYINQKTNTN